MSETAYRDALRALKTADTVPAADDGEATRLRIQASLQLERPRQLRRRRQLLLLAAACLAASSALAFYLARRSEEHAVSARRVRNAETVLKQPPATVAPGPLDQAPREVSPAPAPTAAATASAPTTTDRPRKARSAPRAPSVAESSPVPAPVRAQVTGAERQALYMTAHRLHFGPAPQAALAAWDAYLATEPTGPLSIEAHYNRAVVLARLGQKEAARKELLPFAQGKHGSFRQADAALLLSQLK